MIAVVVFEKVHADIGEVGRIVELMSPASGISCAGLDAAAGIHAEFQSLGVDIIRDGFHAMREFFRIGDEHAVFVAFAQAPAVVDDKVSVAGVEHAMLDHGVGGFLDHILTDIVAEGVP